MILSCIKQVSSLIPILGFFLAFTILTGSVDNCQAKDAKQEQNGQAKANTAAKNKGQDLKNNSAQNKATQNKAIQNAKKDAKKSKAGKNKHISSLSPISDSHHLDWVKLSKDAAYMVRCQKYNEAEPIFLRIIPIAKEGDTTSLEYGVLLLRYGACLTGKKKYPQAMAMLEEALKIIRKTSYIPRHQRAMFQTLKNIAAAHIHADEWVLGEKYSRQAIAYRIAYPNVSSTHYFLDTWWGLKVCLEKQNKMDEAAAIDEILKTYS